MLHTTPYVSSCSIMQSVTLLTTPGMHGSEIRNGCVSFVKLPTRRERRLFLRRLFFLLFWFHFKRFRDVCSIKKSRYWYLLVLLCCRRNERTFCQVVRLPAADCLFFFSISGEPQIRTSCFPFHQRDKARLPALIFPFPAQVLYFPSNSIPIFFCSLGELLIDFFVSILRTNKI